MKPKTKKNKAMRKVLQAEIKKERCNAAALGLFNSSIPATSEPATAKEPEPEPEEEEPSKRLQILEASLKKKEEELQRRLGTHFADVKAGNGQPMNDKRNGQATLNRWDKQGKSIQNQIDSIEKTKEAIIRYKADRDYVKSVKNSLPKSISSLIDKKSLNQWKKYPNTFFVPGVNKARIIWDKKKGKVLHKFFNTITDPDQKKKFSDTYNALHAEFNNKSKK